MKINNSRRNLFLVLILIVLISMIIKTEIRESETVFKTNMLEKNSDQILVYSSSYSYTDENKELIEDENGNAVVFNNSVYAKNTPNGIETIGEETLDNGEYIGLENPCVVDDGIYYTSYSVLQNTYCIIKKNNDTINFILPIDCDHESNVYKVIKNDILYYGYDNVLCSYNLLNGEQKTLISEEVYIDFNEHFDVSENGDIVYTYEYKRMLLKNNGDIIPLEVNAIKFINDNELLCTSGNKLFRYDINTGKCNTVMKVSNGGSLFGWHGEISQIALTNNKETAIIHEVITDGKAEQYYYRIVDINSGKSFRINRGKFYSYLIWADSDTIEFAD